MKWSQLKSRVESLFSDAVKGRVELRLTRYRKANDQFGRGWITIDKAEVVNLCFFTAEQAQFRETGRLQRLHGCADYRDPDQREAYLRVHEEATVIRHQNSVFSSHEFQGALYDYLRLPIEGILTSDNPIIRGLGMLDRRVGKSRLAKISVADQPEFVRRLFEFRREAEGSARLAQAEAGAV